MSQDRQDEEKPGITAGFLKNKTKEQLVDMYAKSEDGHRMPDQVPLAILVECTRDIEERFTNLAKEIKLLTTSLERASKGNTTIGYGLIVAGFGAWGILIWEILKLLWLRP